jgi:membrane protease subunit HflK
MSPTQSTSPGFLQRLRDLAVAGRQLVLNNGRNDGPPDLDELWRDFNRKLGGLFGGKGAATARAAVTTAAAPAARTSSPT